MKSGSCAMTAGVMADMGSSAELKTTYQQLANLGSQLCTNPDAGTTGTTTATTPASCQKFQSLCPGMSMPGSTTP